MTTDYILYTAEDFIADEAFQLWVKFPDPENNALWEQWLSANPGKRDAVMQATAFITDLHFDEEKPDAKFVESQLAASLQMLDLMEDKKKYSLRSWPVVWRSVAALFVIGAGILAWINYTRQPVTLQMVTGNFEVKTFLLPDGSHVTLNANSSITYTSDMMKGAIREVWLEGEAFFDVRHLEQNKKARRFIVHSGDLNVEVLGTTFNVKKRTSVTNVTLNSGKIKIDLQDLPQTAVYLQPGDFVQYSSSEKHLLKKHVKPELYSVWKEEKLQMDNMPLHDIAQLIEDAYGYQIKIDDTKLAASKISGTLRLKDEASLLETLAFALDINIIKKDSVLMFEQKPK